MKIVITLKPLPSLEQRLVWPAIKRLLKFALRSMHLKCVEMKVEENGIETVYDTPPV